MTKKFAISVIFSVITLLGINVVSYAQGPTNKNLRQDIRDERKEIREDQKQITLNLKNINKNARLTDVNVTAVNSNSLTVIKDGKTYTINTSSNTRIRRHYWGKANISEILVNDKVNVWGKWADENNTTINATMIRDLSILKRYGVFFGNVVSKTNDSFTINTLNRGQQTVTFNSKTKFVSRDEKTITYNDIQIGDRVRIKGTWDKSISKIYDVIQIKDFTIPKKASTTPTP